MSATARCDQILSLIDECLADCELSTADCLASPTGAVRAGHPHHDPGGQIPH
jgi:hypothetical protein